MSHPAFQPTEITPENPSQSTRSAGSAWAREKRFADVLSRRMAYIERGEGHPIVFLHGNPTSSFLWRNVLPHAEASGRRLIAPDHCPRWPDCRPFISFSTSYPELNSAVLRHTDNERFVGHSEVIRAAA